MTLVNKVSNEMNEEIALTDNELETVLGGCSPYNGGAPSYSYGNQYPSNDGSSYGQNYSPYGQGYNSPFDTSSCSGSTPSYTTVTYSVTYTYPNTSSSSCGNGY